MAQIDIPDSPVWRRYFKELQKLAAQYPRIPKDTIVEMIGSDKGVQAWFKAKHYTPDE